MHHVNYRMSFEKVVWKKSWKSGKRLAKSWKNLFKIA